MPIKGITKDGSLIEPRQPGAIAQVDTDEEGYQKAVGGLVASYTAAQNSTGQPNEPAPEARAAPLDVTTTGGPNDLGRSAQATTTNGLVAVVEGQVAVEPEVKAEAEQEAKRRGRPPAEKS